MMFYTVIGLFNDFSHLSELRNEDVIRNSIDDPIPVADVRGISKLQPVNCRKLGHIMCRALIVPNARAEGQGVFIYLVARVRSFFTPIFSSTVHHSSARSLRTSFLSTLAKYRLVDAHFPDQLKGVVGHRHTLNESLAGSEKRIFHKEDRASVTGVPTLRDDDTGHDIRHTPVPTKGSVCACLHS